MTAWISAPYPLSVRSPRSELQCLHARRRFAGTVGPPAICGTMWSVVSLCFVQPGIPSQQSLPHRSPRRLAAHVAYPFCPA